MIGGGDSASAVKKAGATRVVVATPVASPEALERLKGEADDVICLHVPQHLGAIGAYYDDFHQLSDAEVIDLLEQAEDLEGAPDDGNRPDD